MPWSAVVEAALYGPGGFYTGDRGAGRTRDYLTSPSLGPVFGAVVSRAIDRCWVAARRPDPWIVVEAGAGSGALAAAVVAAEPACAPALRYLAVEVSPALRAAALGALPAEDPAQILGPLTPGDVPERQHRPGLGPLVAVMAEMPVGPFPGMVIANELLDNLPFDVYERGGSRWLEVRVGSAGEALAETLVPADGGVAAQLELLAPDAPDGGRVPWQPAAREWLRSAIACVEGGRVVLFDYGRTTAAMAAAGGWMRTYRSGGPGTTALADLGLQDITADVATDQLQLLDRALTFSSQSDWLVRNGLDDLATAAAAEWHDRAPLGDLAALRARSRVAEAVALRDPEGLGAFLTIET